MRHQSRCSILLDVSWNKGIKLAVQLRESNFPTLYERDQLQLSGNVRLDYGLNIVRSQPLTAMNSLFR